MPNYKSKFEAQTADYLKRRGVEFEYEKHSLSYIQSRTYKPDFKIGNIFIETKGYFRSGDRSKHLAIREHNPSIDIRFVFMNPRLHLRKDSPTTYAEWADKHGFKWAAREIPEEWLREAGQTIIQTK